MSDIIFGVVGDMRRKEEAWDLAGAVDAKVLSLDEGTMGTTKNHLKVWTKLLQHGGDWLVVLEDDAQPFGPFLDTLRNALDNAPCDIVGLYLGTGYPVAWQRFVKKAVANETANYIVSSHLLHGVGTAIRGHLVDDMLRFVGWMSPEQREWPVDEQITHWMRLRGYRIAYTLPSLVDHADWPSLHPAHPDGDNRDKPRHAHKIGTRPVWDRTRVVDMP